jgi:hypothetical protein
MDAKHSARLSNKEPVDVRVYFKKQALSIGNENQKIAKCKGVRLQLHNSMSEAQDVTVYCATSAWLGDSIITHLLLCQCEKGSQVVDLIES